LYRRPCGGPIMNRVPSLVPALASRRPAQTTATPIVPQHLAPKGRHHELLTLALVCSCVQQQHRSRRDPARPGATRRGSRLDS
jgi:hypothetical protein